ncbi:hypothetical protein MEG1DRAFT_02066 [Photorhabdus temperata subsp. temperata Meg1]|uniref:Uncharacterized protein n=1 Tax=Photorhabdus temperata subsp. temperata Meg1 TaxID=1393735 RepID=A0A081RX22_PHOTE|nr:hypothetical protein MEG1DRAFT_02066 [Photorhabdus temperata subsp. temperata Meg1]
MGFDSKISNRCFLVIVKELQYSGRIMLLVYQYDYLERDSAVACRYLQVLYFFFTSILWSC